jgi:hypothetical protein
MPRYKPYGTDLAQVSVFPGHENIPDYAVTGKLISLLVLIIIKKIRRDWPGQLEGWS